MPRHAKVSMTQDRYRHAAARHHGQALGIADGSNTPGTVERLVQVSHDERPPDAKP